MYLEEIIENVQLESDKFECKAMDNVKTDSYYIQKIRKDLEFIVKKTSNPGTELIKVFDLLDKSSTPRSKGAVICMKPDLSAIDRDNYIVPIWMI